MSKNKTLILGASANPARFSHKAMCLLQSAGYAVVAVGARTDEVCGVPIYNEPVEDANIHTVTLYMNPQRQKPYYDYLISLKPERIIFNPGTENEELVTLAERHGIETTYACTLVMLRTGQYWPVPETDNA